jgi:hypothetical protein
MAIRHCYSCGKETVGFYGEYYPICFECYDSGPAEKLELLKTKWIEENDKNRDDKSDIL